MLLNLIMPERVENKPSEQMFLTYDFLKPLLHKSFVNDINLDL